MLYWICLLLVLLPLVVEYALLRCWRRSIPVRIHVHGTRGKSSTVRKVVRMLRDGGVRTVGKTTGDSPEYLLPDGSIVPIRRRGPARIQEHVRLLHMAAKMRAEAIVVEGMALCSETVFMSEKIIQATHAVITNVRPDHAESMGEGREGVAQTLSLMIPAGKTLYAGKEAGIRSLKRSARDRHAICIPVASGRGKNISFLRQSEALAEAIARDVLERDVSKILLPNLEKGVRVQVDHTKGETTAETRSPVSLPSMPSTMLRRLQWDGQNVSWADFFSANDVLSSKMLLHLCRPFWTGSHILRVALLSTRSDRPLRTEAFMRWLRREPCFDVLVAAGNHASYAILSCLLSPFPVRKKCLLGNMPPALLLSHLVAMSRERQCEGLLVVGLGNAHGYAERWRREFGGTSCL